MKQGEYHYQPCGRQFRIYVCIRADKSGTMSTPADGEPLFNDREEARRRVYQLNGWNYKGAKH